MEICADVIVDLYMRYQMINFWREVSWLILGVSLIGAVVSFIILSNYLFRGDKSPKAFVISLSAFSVGFVGSVVVVLYVVYLRDVVLKPEIARAVVPVGLDAVGVISKEVEAMWDLLKGLLTK